MTIRDPAGAPRVVVTDYNFPDLKVEEELVRSAGGTLEAYRCTREDEVVAAVRGAAVVLTQFAPVTRRAIEALSPGATIVRYGVGVDNIDLRAARERGVSVACVPDYCVDEVADHTVAMLLALLRKLPRMDRGVRAGEWNPVAMAAPMPPFNRTCIGIAGFGRIGRAVKERLAPFRFRVLVYDPFIAGAVDGVSLVSDPSEFLAAVDALLLHMPLTPATKHWINRETIRKMKRSAVIVNTSRGGLIDTDALVEALEEGILAGAALDVFEAEPLPSGSRLLAAPNLLLSPHVAWYSDESRARLQRLAAEEAVRALRSEPLRCPVQL